MQWIDRITMIFIMNNKILIHVSLISILHRKEQLTMLDGELSDHRARSKNISVAPDVMVEDLGEYSPVLHVRLLSVS
jgi:hypothetical protein